MSERVQACYIIKIAKLYAISLLIFVSNSIGNPPKVATTRRILNGRKAQTKPSKINTKIPIKIIQIPDTKHLM